MHWNWLVIALSGVLLVAWPSVAPLAVLASLIPLLRVTWQAWQAAEGTALRPAVLWAAIALGLGLATAGAAACETVASGRPIAGHLSDLSSLATLAALVSVLNARTPGEGAWALLTALLLVVLLIPWLEGPGLGRVGSSLVRLRLRNPWDIFFCLLVFAGVTNFLPTRFGFAAGWLLLGFALEAGGLTGWINSNERRALVWTAFPWTLAAAVETARRLALVNRRMESRCEALWFWFRDHWGVVWGLRTLERFNRSAEAQGWSCRLAWQGLVDQNGRATTAPEAAEAVLAGLLRRFATPVILARSASRADFPSCQSADGSR